MNDWRMEFQYLLDGKILSKDELAYLFGQIKSIINRELTSNAATIAGLREACERALDLLRSCGDEHTGIAKQLAAALAEHSAEAKVSPWVSVEDRLPSPLKHKDVIIKDSDKNYLIRWSNRHGCYVDEMAGRWSQDDIKKGASEWMPIPPLPEKE